MLPSLLAHDIVEGLKNFIITGFETPTPLFGGMFTRFVEETGNLYKGPFLSVGLPYQPGTAGRDFFSGFETAFSPFVHQEQAWQRLRSDGEARSTIIATGTGSGKTECFLYPLLDHCLRNPGRGIKAVVIYPMNALATDQAKRFAQAIHGSTTLRGKVRVGLYVGEGEESPHKSMGEDFVITDKDTLREAPPDILLTNYKMLDYLLIRPKDRPLWRFNGQDTLRYLVVDELHTFDGAQGTDLACLIRRLKARLKTSTGRLICVGTSATLGSGEEKSNLTDYARRIFQASFDDDSIIGESRQTMAQFLGDCLIEHQFYPAVDLDKRLDADRYNGADEYLAAQYALMFPDQPAAEPDNPAWRSRLGGLLRKHLLFHNLLRLLVQQPRPLGELAAEMGKTLPAGEVRILSHKVLDSLCALIACARDPENPKLPLVQLRLQLWVRELRRMVARVQPGPGDARLAFADDLKQGNGEIYLPLVQCSACHATAWVGAKPPAESKIKADLRAIYNDFFQHSPDIKLLFPLTEEETPPAARGFVQKLCGACGNVQTEGRRCNACGEACLAEVYIPDNMRQRQMNGVPRTVSEHHCPVCGAQESMMIFGSRAASLGSVAIHHSYASVYNDDRKMIAFSDSVQDAAHRAGFFTARTWQNNVRMAIAQALAGSGIAAVPLTEFYKFLPRFWMNADLNEGAFDRQKFVCEFIAPNMLWYSDYAALQQQGKLPEKSTLVEDVCKRLEWEVLAEFGYRSRIGRSLERTSTVSLGIELEPVRRAVEAALVPLCEELGLRDLAPRELEHFMLGLLLYLKERGAVYHRFLQTYIESGGRNYLLGRQTYLPTFTDKSASPRFLTSAARHPEFDTLTGDRGQTWYQRWCAKVLGRNRLLPERFERELYTPVLQALMAQGLLLEMEVRGERVWALNPEMLYLTDQVTQLATGNRRSHLSLPKAMHDAVTGMPSLAMNDAGLYAEQPDQPHWLTHLYRHGQIHRVIAEEHTGLLERDDREALERRFIEGGKPWYPNLLSATPTLEMGIDIGDLSSVLLCSVPPAQANYLQRIGRAGRRDGNAFSLAVAAGRPHDLYFYAAPQQMMAGRVETPGVFLNASAVIERQLTAYCMDCWVATGVDDSAIPAALRPVLDHVEKGALHRFPYNFLEFVKRNSSTLLEGFVSLFQSELSERTRACLAYFLSGDTGDGENMEMRIVKRLHELVNERQSLKSRIDALKRHIDGLTKLPQDDTTKNELDAARKERGGLQAVLRAINSKQTLNFFTDEGLIPNYAFPEAGVMLRSVIYRRREGSEEGKGRYENTVYEYERPGAAAISELAPENSFYAGGRKVSITQVDLGLSDIETWRFCPSCSHAKKLVTGDSHSSCPRCGDAMWADAGQRRQMVRLRQVMANTSDKDSRIGDDSDDREPVFYTRQMLADFSTDDVEVAYRVASDKLPFGFEFIRKTTFREMNFGEYGEGQEPSFIAGIEASRPGFILCQHCGMVQDKWKREQAHAFTCKARDRSDPANLVDCLYLYREFTSEAIRILLPTSAMVGSDRALNSFIAAIQLGLKKKFGGQVDHLRMMSYDEPTPDSAGERRYLMLYDTVPGGTGYLHELMRDHLQLLEVFRMARDTMAACQCNQDPEKDGCYHCLYAYRNSYGMETTSRITAVALLSDILEAADRFEKVRTISDIISNPIMESELETRFVEAVRLFSLPGFEVQLQQQVVKGKPGYFLRVNEHCYTIEPQADLGSCDGVRFASRPDFLIRSARESTAFKPMAVFMDGFKYHKDKVTEDTAKRLAIVQSNCYWQWSLTWEDIKIQSASARQMRNPFAESMHPEMQVVRDRLIESMGIGKLAKIPLRLPLEQFMSFLADPSPAAWRNTAFVQCLGWFDQKNMCDEASRAVFMADFTRTACTGLQHLLDDMPGSNAYGFLGPNGDDDPLRVMCTIPLSAIKLLDSKLMTANLVFDTGKTSNEEAFKAGWQGFLRLYNLLQFIPATGFTTLEGAGKGIYEAIEWRFAAAALKPESSAGEGADSSYASEVLKDTDETLHEGLRRLIDKNLPLPQVAYELQDKSGEIIAEAELGWVEQRIAGLLPHQEAYIHLFVGNSWMAVILDAEGEWVDQVEHLIREKQNG